MTQDEIIRMAREAGFSVGLDDPIIYAAHERFAALVASHEREKQAEQEPVGVVTKEALDGVVKWKRWVPREGTKLYAAPVRTKDPCHSLQDLTDDEIWEVFETHSSDVIKAVRAVIAADREKNRA